MSAVYLNPKADGKSDQGSKTFVERFDIFLVLGTTLFGGLMLSTLFYFY